MKKSIAVLNGICSAKWLCMVFLMVLIVGALSGCNFDKITGKGDMVKRLFDVGSFDSVEIKNTSGSSAWLSISDTSIKNGFELIYRSGPENKVEVEMQENLFEYLNVRVEGSRLILDSSKPIQTDTNKRPKLYVTMPAFKGLTAKGEILFKDADNIEGERFIIDVSGACDMDLNMNIESLEMNVSGAGEIKLQGRAQKAKVDLSGAGEINAMSLDTVDAEVDISGAGDCEISCSGTLKADVSGAGSIKYKGHPNLTKDVSGAGSIEQVN